MAVQKRSRSENYLQIILVLTSSPASRTLTTATSDQHLTPLLLKRDYYPFETLVFFFCKERVSTMSTEKQLRKRLYIEAERSHKKQKATPEGLSNAVPAHELNASPGAESPSLSDNSSVSDLSADGANAPVPESVLSRSTTTGPLQIDVLLGRGRPCQKHFGNLRMLKIVDEQKPRYTSAPREQRRAIAETVLDLVYEGGARFLKNADDHWESVTRNVALDKVSHALRSKGNVQERKRQRIEEGGSADPFIERSMPRLAQELAFLRASAGFPGLPPSGTTPSWTPPNTMPVRPNFPHPNALPLRPNFPLMPHQMGMMQRNFTNPNAMGREALIESMADRFVRAQLADSLFRNQGK
jgi:hypothetical protein